MEKLIIPEKLKKGDAIAFVSPSAGSAPFAMHRIEKAKLFFERNGYKVKIAKNALKNAGYVSASAKERADDLHEVFSDKEVKCVIATIGGNHSNQVLPYIDWGLIKNNPKIFVGYSDISVLHYAIQSQAGLQTYYGPAVLTQFGEYPEIFDYTWKYFQLAVCPGTEQFQVEPSQYWTDDCSRGWTDKADLARPKPTNKNEDCYVWLRSGCAEGKVVGGCVPSINHLLGTKFWVEPEDSIFFIDIPEGYQWNEKMIISEVDSYLADLYNVGVFDSINGLIIGRPFRYSQEDFKILSEIILQYARNKDYPILAQTNIGHVDPIITVPFGAEVFLNSEENIFSINNQAVK